MSLVSQQVLSVTISAFTNCKSVKCFVLYTYSRYCKKRFKNKHISHFTFIDHSPNHKTDYSIVNNRNLFLSFWDSVTWPWYRRVRFLCCHVSVCLRLLYSLQYQSQSLFYTSINYLCQYKAVSLNRIYLLRCYVFPLPWYLSG